MKNYEFLFWAYNIIWLGLAGFLAYILLRMRKTAQRLERIERELERPS
jgi:CcmD family protein